MVYVHQVSIIIVLLYRTWPNWLNHPPFPKEQSAQSISDVPLNNLETEEPASQARYRTEFVLVNKYLSLIQYMYYSPFTSISVRQSLVSTPEKPAGCYMIDRLIYKHHLPVHQLVTNIQVLDKHHLPLLQLVTNILILRCWKTRPSTCQYGIRGTSKKSFILCGNRGTHIFHILLEFLWFL